MIEAISRTDLVEASGGDVYAEVALRTGDVDGTVWAGDGAVLWTRDWHGRPSVTGVGTPAGVAAVLTHVADALQDAIRVSLPRGFADRLAPALSFEPRSEWDWLWTDAAPPALPHEPLVHWLGERDHDDVRALLEEVSPDASARPGDGRSRRWAGIRTGDGRLAACLADTSRAATVGHVSSVATAAEFRRNGYGAALTAWATRAFLAEGRSPATLGMYSWNDGARRMYHRLGYVTAHSFAAGTLTRAPNVRRRALHIAS
ncbi:MAG: GNAT family N-acetyltransferase [Streptosporangiales bacterium]|nr:GNAT family N-acetyltransferase [Streptosporangiales bacterium]